jgi:hypothetical protein
VTEAHDYDVVARVLGLSGQEAPQELESAGVALCL